MKNLKLLIVESPAKIKTISKFLGPEFKIMSTFGHVKDLPTKTLGVKIDEETKTIDIEYVPIKDKAKTIAQICKVAAGANEVYLASDPDREGEIISWHIGQEIEKASKNITIHRITFNEITKPAVLEAIQNQSTINLDVVKAQQARRVLDRWVGYEVSPVLWRKIRKGLSAGRVQSVAVLLVCNREEEIQKFKPEESWSIHADFKLEAEKFASELFKISNKALKLKNKGEADKVVAEIKNVSNFSVSKITDKTRIKKPPTPFMTSTLQQDSYNKLGLSVKQTMMIAQKLYEGIPLTDRNKPEALITYMRTDSLRISDTALKATRSFINKNYGTEYLPKKANLYSKKGAQDAHESIRPVNVDITPDVVRRFSTPEQAKLYELIWKRFVACQMTPAKYAQRLVLTQGDKFTFKSIGSSLIFDGFLKAYLIEDKETKEAVKIPTNIKENVALEIQKPKSKQHFTQPPARYTEASLVKELEKQGVGRPSTYAATLFTIQKREYVSKEKKRFVPTELGTTVTKMLTENLPDIINVKFTANMEEDLDKIAQGKKDRNKVLLEFYEKFKKDLKKFMGTDSKKQVIKTNLKCPECEETLVIRFGKAGEFIGCPGFPKCKFTSNFERNEQGDIKLIARKEPETSDIKCPKCGKNLVTKVGKYGPFLSCPGYPKCKYIHQESLKMPCPQCEGKIVKRKWRGGSFWGCSNYPKCKFSIFDQVIDQPCPKCKNPHLAIKKSKDGSEEQYCINPKCDYREK